MHEQKICNNYLYIPLALLGTCAFAKNSNLDEVKNLVLERCLENQANTEKACQCLAEEIFEKFTLEHLVRVNSFLGTSAEVQQIVDWLQSKPCGIDSYPISH